MNIQAGLLRAVQHLRDQVGDRRSDFELLRRYARDSDEDAFSALVRGHAALVFGVARRQLSDPHRAEDVFQATFLALARSAATLTKERSLTNWLYTVALRQARKAKLRDARQAANDRKHILPNAPSPDPLEELTGRELVSLVDDELNRLPAIFRLPILLCCIEGLSREEAAERLGWSPGSVKGRLERARRRLADRLAEKGLTPSLLFLDPLARAVPESLLRRTVALSACPWSATIPSRIADLTTASSRTNGITVFAACASLLVVIGLAVIFVQSSQRQPQFKQSARTPVLVKSDKYPLPDQALQRFGTSRFRHGMRISNLAVSRDGRFAVAAGGTGPWESIRSFDLRDGRRLTAFPNHENNVEGIAIAPDGKTVAVIEALQLHCYDLQTGKELAALQPVKASSRFVNYWMTFSPDGSLLALAPLGNEILFIDVATKKIVRKIRRSASLTSGVFTPDGQQFLAGGYDYDADKKRYIRLWDVATGNEIRKFNNGKNGILSLAVSPDGTLLAAAGMDGRTRMWDLATGKLLHQFTDGSRQVSSVAFSPNGKTLAAAGNTIHLNDLATNKSRAEIRRKANWLHFSPTSWTLVGSVAGTIHKWDAQTGEQLTPAGVDSSIEQIEIGLGGRVVITHDCGGVASWVDPTNRTERLGFSGIPSGRDIPQTSVIHLWERSTGKLLWRLQLNYQGEIAVTPDGRYLVLGVDDPKFKYTPRNLGLKLKLFDLAKQSFVDRFPAIIATKAQWKAITGDGKSLVTVDIRDSRVRVWDMADGSVQSEFSAFKKTEKHGLYAVLKSCLSPDGKTLALAYGRHYPLGRQASPTLLRLWDIRTGKLLKQLDGHCNLILDLAFSPDGHYLASCEESPKDPHFPNRKDSFHVWDVTTGKRISPHQNGLADRANRVAFSPNGRTLTASSFDGSVSIWEVASWARRSKFQAHADHVTVLRYADDGTLLTGSTDATALAWRLRPTKPKVDTPLSQAWKTLRATDAKAAYQSQGRFLASPNEAVAFLAKHLSPAKDVVAKRIAKLLADLDSENFATRERATRALSEYGRQIEKQLRDALAKTPSEEVRRRLEMLLTQLAPTMTPPAELRKLRAVEILEWIATPQSQELLVGLAKGSGNAVLTRESRSALRRLASRK